MKNSFEFEFLVVELSDLIDMIGAMVKVRIDRPLGSQHPTEQDLIYELNYGFIPNLIVGDGSELDAYVLDSTIPLEINKEYSAVCRGVINRENDIEDKLVVCLDPRYVVSKQEIEEKTFFQEKYFNSIIIV